MLCLFLVYELNLLGVEPQFIVFLFFLEVLHTHYLEKISVLRCL